MLQKGLKVDEDFPALLADVTFDGAYIVDLDRRMLAWNKAATRITGFEPDEVLGHTCMDYILQHCDDAGEDLCKNRCPLAEVMAGGKPHDTFVFLHHKKGHRVKVEVRCVALRNKDGEITSALEVFREIPMPADSYLQEIESLKKEVMTDPLTGVGNRRYANILLSRLLEPSEAETKPREISIALIDIDYFKQVNDAYGHGIGDDVLRMVANSLQAALRPRDALCRWGGEEFLAILPDAKAENLMLIIERMRSLVASAWFDLENDRKIRVTVSIDAVQIHDDETIKSAIHRADCLLYKAKQDGRNRCVAEDGISD